MTGVVGDLPYELPEYFSPSSLSTFVQCPLKYKYSRVNKMSEPPTMQTLMGNFVHDVLENFYLTIPGPERNQASAKAVSSQIWAEGGWAERVSPYLGKTKLNDFLWNSWWCIENVFKLESPESIVPSGVETELNGHIRGIRIKGFIDRWGPINGQLTVSDYKTGKTPKPRYLDDKFPQLLIYAIVLAETEDVKVDLVELLYLKDATRFSKEVTQTDVDSVSTMVESVSERVHTAFDTNKWPANPTILCNWCHFKTTVCEYWNKQ